eukprot:1160879-Pelagomonas_calceolata.AAC.7
MKLAELVLVMVPESVEDEHMFSALKYLKIPQRNKLMEMHINVCARGFKSMECNLSSFPYPDAIGRKYCKGGGGGQSKWHFSGEGISLTVLKSGFRQNEKKKNTDA